MATQDTPCRDYPPVPHRLYEEGHHDRDREGDRQWEYDLDDDYGTGTHILNQDTTATILTYHVW